MIIKCWVENFLFVFGWEKAPRKVSVSPPWRSEPIKTGLFQWNAGYAAAVHINKTMMGLSYPLEIACFLSQ